MFPISENEPSATSAIIPCSLTLCPIQLPVQSIHFLSIDYSFLNSSYKLNDIAYILCDWHFSHRIMSSGFIHFATCKSCSFLILGFNNKQFYEYSIVNIAINQLMVFGFFYFQAIMSTGALIIHVYGFVEIYVF